MPRIKKPAIQRIWPTLWLVLIPKNIEHSSKKAVKEYPNTKYNMRSKTLRKMSTRFRHTFVYLWLRLNLTKIRGLFITW